MLTFIFDDPYSKGSTVNYCPDLNSFKQVSSFSSLNYWLINRDNQNLSVNKTTVKSCSNEGLTLEMSAYNHLHGVKFIHINLRLIHYTVR